MGRLETVGLTYVYPTGIKALDSVNFVADSGQFVLVLGPNGSGKTTLFRHFSCSLHATSGTVLIDGREVGKGDLSWVYRTVGFVFQDPNDQLFAATVEEDVAFGPRNLGLPAAEVERRVSRCLEMVGLPGFERRPVHALSFGQKRRVAVAGVLALRPEIIVLDEPTAGLDPMGASRMMDLLYRLKRDQGVTIVMATHDIDFVPRYADLVYVLRRGHVVARGTPAEVFAQSKLIHESELRLPRAAQALQLVGRELGYSLDGLPFTLDEPMPMAEGSEPPSVVRRSDGHLAGPASDFPISLGAAGAAASLAAVELLFHGRTMPDVELRSPVGAVVRVPVTGVGEVTIEEHRVAVAAAASDAAVSPGEISLTVKAEARQVPTEGIQVFGGPGIGHTHTHIGDREVDLPAISPLVRQMIADAVRAAVPEDAGVQISLSVPGGAEMARRGLGQPDVVDGISLAGSVWPAVKLEQVKATAPARSRSAIAKQAEPSAHRTRSKSYARSAVGRPRTKRRATDASAPARLPGRAQTSARRLP